MGASFLGVSNTEKKDFYENLSKVVSETPSKWLKECLDRDKKHKLTKKHLEEIKKLESDYLRNFSKIIQIQKENAEITSRLQILISKKFMQGGTEV